MYKVGDVVIRTETGSAEVGTIDKLREYDPTVQMWLVQGSSRYWDESAFKLYDAAPKPVEAVVGKFEALANEIGKLTDKKSAAYGDSVGTSGKALKLLFPNGIPVDRYGDVLLIARVWDKLMRIATDKDAMGEDPWKDICGYGLVASGKKEDNR